MGSNEKLVRADLLWEFLDAMNKGLNNLMLDVESKSSENIKLITFGRREIVKAMTDWLYENQTDFQDICDQMGYEIRSMDDS